MVVLHPRRQPALRFAEAFAIILSVLKQSVLVVVVTNLRVPSRRSGGLPSA